MLEAISLGLFNALTTLFMLLLSHSERMTDRELAEHGHSGEASKCPGEVLQSSILVGAIRLECSGGDFDCLPMKGLWTQPHLKDKPPVAGGRE